MASSRVGARISARGSRYLLRACSLLSSCRIGKREGGGLAGARLGDAQKVLAVREFSGMACAWIGVGVTCSRLMPMHVGSARQGRDPQKYFLSLMVLSLYAARGADLLSCSNACQLRRSTQTLFRARPVRADS